MVSSPACALLLLVATPARMPAEPTSGFSCRGGEQSWTLRIEESAATLTRHHGARLALAGRLQKGAGARSFVFRGRAQGDGDLVAVVTVETCTDDARGAEGSGSASFTARISLATGEMLQGCCTAVTEVEAQPVAQTKAAPRATLPPSSPGAARAPGGDIAALALPDGRVCLNTGKGATAAVNGERLNFDCGRSGGLQTVLVGSLALGPDGLLMGRRATEIEWRSGELGPPPPARATPVRVDEITLADGLSCRAQRTSAGLAFGGRRASYSCGMRDGQTVALLGELEPDEGGFRIVRARLAQGEQGLEIRAEETILVSAPR